ncbi:MAG: UTRA domain-containing protein [Rhodobacteraceae bacterium]|nr:UTRA domain-containing protein [Paracoccaceae bacterium]
MPTNGKVTFRSVKEMVLARIRSNVWPPGSILPGEVELADELGCARATVNRAMRELAEEGILDRKRKTGTRVNPAPIRKASFVIPIVREEIEATGATYRYVLVNSTLLTAPDWLRARIGLAPTDRVRHVQCMHYAGSIPYQFEDRWINLSGVPTAEQADFQAMSPNEWLIKQVPFSEAELSFSATRADTGLAEFLAMTTGDPVFTAERITWLDEQPVTFARMSFARGYRLTTRL